jgi:hypothetical protein
MGRVALLEVISEARNTEWCKREVLDELERYATYPRRPPRPQPGT